MFKVEYMQDNEWVRHSWHKNQIHAEINAEVLNKSRGTKVRIIKEGKIVLESG